MLMLLGSFLVPDADRRARRDRDGRRLAALHRLISGTVPDVIAGPAHDRRRRELPAAGRAVLHPGRQPDEHRRRDGPHLRFAVCARRLDAGGLAQVNIIGSVIFSGMSGTAIADAAGIGTIEIKAMKDHGYRPRSRSASPPHRPRSGRSSRRRCLS
jgi:hypothetical protein